MILLTGSLDCGKTTFCREFARTLRERGISTGGILSPASLRGGSKSVYSVESVRSGRRRHLLDIGPSGPVLDKKGFAFGNRVLAAARACRAVIVDEFGPIELSGRGFAAKVASLSRAKGPTLFVVVRKSLVGRARLALGARMVFDLERESDRRRILGWRPA